MKWLGKLLELGLASWDVLEYGFRRGWISRTEIAEYAVSLLLDTSLEEDDRVPLLADAENCEDDEIRALLSSIPKNSNDRAKVAEKWRLIRLSQLNDSNLTDQAKVDRLQELYAEFDYPEDMQSCDVYSRCCLDPLVGMNDVIQKLKREIQRDAM